MRKKLQGKIGLNDILEITACAQPYAIRAYCIKLAYEQMKFYPELLEELKTTLDMLEQEPLSPGLLSAKRQVMKKIKRKLEHQATDTIL